MKKVIIILFLISVHFGSSSAALRRALVPAAVAVGAAPVMVPGAYYWYQVRQEYAQKILMLQNDGSSLDQLIKSDMQYTQNNIERFLLGTFLGAAPGINLVTGGLWGLSISKSCLDWSLKRPDPFEGLGKYVPNIVGFFSGSSLYVSIPLAVILAKLAKRCPK